MSKCGESRCKTCSLIIEAKQNFTLSTFTIALNANMNCKTSNVIYIMICNNCNAYYVGETKMQLRLRVNLHRQHINNAQYSILKVSEHIRNCGGNFKIIPIFKLRSKCNWIRKKQELYFITMLKPPLNV